MTKVGVYETEVFGCKAWHTRCLNCGKQTKRRDKQEQAVADAKKHQCEITKEQFDKLVDWTSNEEGARTV